MTEKLGQKTEELAQETTKRTVTWRACYAPIPQEFGSLVPPTSLAPLASLSDTLLTSLHPRTHPVSTTRTRHSTDCQAPLAGNVARLTGLASRLLGTPFTRSRPSQGAQRARKTPSTPVTPWSSTVRSSTCSETVSPSGVTDIPTVAVARISEKTPYAVSPRRIPTGPACVWPLGPPRRARSANAAADGGGTRGSGALRNDKPF